MSTKAFILLRGLPGSGKTTTSTFLKKLLEANGKAYVVCSADDFFIGEDGAYNYDKTKLPAAHEQCYKHFQEAVESSIPTVVLDNTNTMTSEFDKYIKLAHEHKYKTHSLVCENRHEGKSLHNVPDYAIERMKARFDLKL